MEAGSIQPDAPKCCVAMMTMETVHRKMHAQASVLLKAEMVPDFSNRKKKSTTASLLRHIVAKYKRSLA